MDYMTLKEASEKWGVTTRWINYLCTAGRIPGAVKMGTVWLIPKGSDMPSELGPGQWKGIHPGNCKSQRDTSNRAVSHFGCHQCLQPNWRGWSKHL